MKFIIQKHLKKLKFLVTVLAIVMIGVIFYKNPDILKRLSKISWWYLGALFLVNLLHVITQMINFRALIYALGLKLKAMEALELTMAGRFYNFVFPLKAGNILRSVYLKKVHLFPYKNFLLFMFYQFISFFIVIPLLLALLFFAIPELSLEQKLIYALIALSVSLAAFFLSRGTSLFYKFLKLKKVDFKFENLPIINRFHRLNISLGVISFWFASGLKLYIAFKAVDMDFSLLKCMVVSGSVLIITQLGITPGDMGSKEFIISFAAKLLQLPLGHGLLGAFVDRAAEIMVTVPFGLIYGNKIMKSQSINLKEHMKKEADIQQSS